MQSMALSLQADQDDRDGGDNEDDGQDGGSQDSENHGRVRIIVLKTVDAVFFAVVASGQLA